MLDALKSYNVDAHLFEGVPGDLAVRLAAKSKKTLYPYSIKNRDVSDDDLRRLIRPELYEEFKERYHYKIAERQPIGEDHIGKLSRPGVVGCFYSHYAL
jgi:hypothetical protein